MTEVPLEYLKAHVPDEYERRMANVRKGINSAQARDAAKKKMLERMAWIIDEFHKRAVEAGLEYLNEEDDTANRKFFGLAKNLEKRYPERSKQKEYLEWWFENGEWANFHPSNFFSVSEWMKFENPKAKKSFIDIDK